MTGIDYFALIVLLVLIVTLVVGWVVLAMLPGRIAAKNNHPQARAVNVAGWLGAIFGGVLWPLVLVWSMIKNPTVHTVGSGALQELETENSALKQRVAELEARATEKG